MLPIPKIAAMKPFITPAFKSVFLLLAFSLTLIACKDKDPIVETKSGTGDLKGFQIAPLPGSQYQSAVLVENGRTIVEGYIDAANKKTGQWVEYIPEGDIALIENFIDGNREGMVLKFTNHGQIENKSYYKQGSLHGPWVQYKFGKVVEERNYDMGKLDGVVKKYTDRTWKLAQEIEYKQGKQHGFFRHYDEEGNVTLEYEYKDGEKVSGGIVEKK